MILQGKVLKRSLCLAVATRDNTGNAQVVQLMLGSIAEWLAHDSHAQQYMKRFGEVDPTITDPRQQSVMVISQMVLLGMLAGLTQGVQMQIDQLSTGTQPIHEPEKVVH